MLHHRHHPETVAERIDALMIAVFLTDDVDRIRRLAEHLAPGFVYISPSAVVQGPQGLSDAFSAHRHDAWRHTTLRRTSEVDVHHAQLRYTWERREGVATVMEGCSFGSMNPDGKLSRIVSFDGLVPVRSA